ncbi:TonB-dependent receptor plug domain-containing protein [Methyloprofundus sp.]|uniref:TonB-dependent receptor plug domain-containing protein n=1 Tax=Methyloprofundus sp. TaxID=2020875 RepID=UPI003D10B1EF
MYAEPLAGIEPASDSSTSGTISLGSEQLTPGGTVVFDTLLIEENSLAPMSYNVFDASSATKTDTPIMEIPQSIQVIPKAVLRDQDLQTLGSAVENVSSVVAPKTTELLTSEFIIRGFKSQFYTDSMPTYGQGNGADPLSLVNVERIEVVKGPTSTLFGGGLGAPTGGLINVVSKQPLPEAQYIVSFRGGSFRPVLSLCCFFQQTPQAFL